ncbi:MAG: HAD family hydrolase [Planctomycetota bacterium]
MFRAILFDLDNTLIDRQTAFRLYAIDFCRRRLQLHSPLEQEQALKELLAADDWGYRSRDEFCEWVSGRFPAAQLQPGDIWEDCCQHLPTFVEPDSRVQGMLARLADRFRLLAVTNGSGRNQHEKLRRAQLNDYLQEAIVSGEVGFEKPHPAIFERALAIAGCSADEAIVVGDDPQADIVGAKQAGLKACWVSLGRRYPAGMIPPDEVLFSVLDLERWLV